MTKTIIDVCCGSRMFHFDKNNENVVFMDNREIEETLCDGRTLKVAPDIVADFRKNSWLVKKYGKLSENWSADIKKGFDECMRILKPEGTLVFKWSTKDISFKQILDVIKVKPIIFHKNNNTFFLVFHKGGKQ